MVLERSSLGARPLAGQMGAVIDSIDLSDPLSGEMVEELHHLLAERGVVVFTNQELDAAGHVALAQKLGKIRMPPKHIDTLGAQGYPEIGVLASKPGGNRADVWHSDVTWAPQPPRYSILHMQISPEAGGDTMWASLLEAYERLSPPMRQFLQMLTARHELVYPGRSGDSPKQLEARSAVHPVIHRHPLSGRVALGVNPCWTKRIVELDESESASVLDVLFEKILQPESICRWHWHVGDVAIWDNCFVLHYAINDYGDVPRVIHRIEIEGGPLIPVNESNR